MPSRRPADEDLLFDLPLDTTTAAPTAADRSGAPEEEQPDLPLMEDAAAASDEAIDIDAESDGPEAAADEVAAAPPTAPRRRSSRGGLGPRLTAGLTDLAVCAAVLVVLLVSLLALGVRPEARDWPAGLVFLLAFSFLYSVLPLAFWGRTPGMVLAGLRTSSDDGRPLTFRQAVFNWLGRVLTVALLGLPLLLSLGGRSLSDRLSGGRTRPLARP